MSRHGTLPPDRSTVAFGATYVVYAYTMIDGLEFTDLVAFFGCYDIATRLAWYAVRLGCSRAEVLGRCDDGSFESCYEMRGDEYCRDEVLESLRQLREAGEVMPDPEDSPFFATPCEPMAVI